VDSKTKDHLFQQGIQAFNEGRFYDAHEEWEHIWLEEKGADKPFYQGLIQIAAGFHHFKRQKTKPASTCIAAGLDKLKPYITKPPYPVDLAQLCSDVSAHRESPPKIHINPK